MQKNYRRIRRHLCILLLVCIVSTFPIVTVPVFAAEGTGVTVTNVPSMLWEGLGSMLNTKWTA